MIYVISKPIVFTLVGKSPPFGCFYCPQSMPRCPHSPLPALHCPSSLGWLPWVALCQLILPFVERPKAVAQVRVSYVRLHRKSALTKARGEKLGQAQNRKSHCC